MVWREKEREVQKLCYTSQQTMSFILEKFIELGNIKTFVEKKNILKFYFQLREQKSITDTSH